MTYGASSRTLLGADGASHGAVGDPFQFRSLHDSRAKSSEREGGRSWSEMLRDKESSFAHAHVFPP